MLAKSTFVRMSPGKYVIWSTRLGRETWIAVRELLPGAMIKRQGLGRLDGGSEVWIVQSSP